MKFRMFLSGFLFSIFAAIMMWQTQYVLAEDPLDPITAPVTSPTATPTPTDSPVTSPVTPTPTTPVTAPAPTTSPANTDVLATNLASLLNSILVLAENAVGTVTQTLTVASPITINVNNSAATIAVPTNTVISRVDGQTFDANALTSNIVPVSTIVPASTISSIGALQWGIPSVGLQFSQPITLSIVVGNAYNGQTLQVLRSTTGTGNWTSDGLVSATCAVSNGTCTFQATKASYYVVGQAVASQSQGSSNNNSGGSSNSNSNNASCNAAKPGSAPVLLSAKVTGKNQVTLVWTKAKDPVSYYLVAYGLKSGVLQYGNPNVGGVNTTSVVINGLSGNTTYYFKVRAGNGCTPGDYSNELSVTVGGATIEKPAAGFEEGVLAAKATPTVIKSKPSAVQTQPMPAALPAKKNLFERIVIFVKSFFSN